MSVLLESFLAALAMVYIVFAMPELGAGNGIYASTCLAPAAPLSTRFNKGGPGSVYKKCKKGDLQHFCLTWWDLRVFSYLVEEQVVLEPFLIGAVPPLLAMFKILVFKISCIFQICWQKTSCRYSTKIEDFSIIKNII